MRGARGASRQWQRLKFQRGNFCPACEIIFCDMLCLGRLSENILLSKGVVWQADFLVACVFYFSFFNWGARYSYRLLQLCKLMCKTVMGSKSQRQNLVK